MNSFFKRALIGGGGLRKRYLKSRAGAIQLNYLVFFTLRHGGHIGVSKQRNSGHVGVPRKSGGN